MFACTLGPSGITLESFSCSENCRLTATACPCSCAICIRLREADMVQLMLRRKTNDLNGIWGQNKMKSFQWAAEWRYVNSEGMCLEKLRKQGSWVPRLHPNLDI